MQEIKKVTSQLKGLSNEMVVKVESQGLQINNIESNIKSANTNVVRAELEIEEAQKMDKKSRKKTIIFIIIGFLVAIGVGLGVYFGVFHNKK